MQAGNVARVVFVVAACVAAVGSATSGSNNASQQQYGYSPPPPSQMESTRALGLWRSTFGPVKIESDESRGGIQAGAVQGVWTYQRRGQDVIGYFYGSLRGNVLQFAWNEPAKDAGGPPLAGEGYLVFDPSGRQYSGRWWTEKRENVGDWNGWRQAAQQTAQYGQQPYGQQYGGQTYGYQPRPQPQYPQQGQQQYPYPQQPQQQYPQQPQQYPPQQQYPQQQYPQQQYPQPQQPQQPQQPGYPQGY
jgi:hypothetical protein